MAAAHRAGNQANRKTARAKGRHRASSKRDLQPYTWLGAGAITLGMGAAALAAGAGNAYADEGTAGSAPSGPSSSASASTDGATSSGASSSSTGSKKAVKPKVNSKASAGAKSAKKSKDDSGTSGSAADNANPDASPTGKPSGTSSLKSHDTSAVATYSASPSVTTDLKLKVASSGTAAALTTAGGSASPTVSAAASTPSVGPRHVSSGGDLFLGGNYIELGISNVGSFGTPSNKPDNFVGGTPPGAHPNSVGLSYDSDGFGTGTAPSLDFYVPDAPEERWSVGFNDSKYAGFSALNGNSGNAANLSNVSLSDSSAGNTLSGTFTATVDNSLKVKQVHSFDVNDSFYKTEVTLTNTTSTKLTNVEFMRSFDPDGTRSVGGSNTTTNIVGGQFATQGYTLVTASSLVGDAYNTLTGNLAAAFIYTKGDPKAIAYTGGFSNSNPYDYDDLGQEKGYSTSRDDAIGIIFRVGDLAPGASITFSYYTGVTTSDDPLAIVNKVAEASGDDTAFGSAGPGGIKGRPTPEQFIRGVLSFVKSQVTRVVNSIATTVHTIVATVAKPAGVQSPVSTAKLFDRLWGLTGVTNSDGVWVDKVDASDGTRFVVYIGGTSGFWGNSQTVWANWDTYGYKLKDAQVSAIRKAIYDGGGTIDSKVMLVGYSQGGLDAQNIAEKSNFNVTAVVTFGTPIIYDPPSRYSIIHIGALGDPVPGLSKNPQKDENIAAGNAYGVRTRTYSTYSSQWLNPFWEWNLHGDKDTYLQAGSAFDKYTDPKFDFVKEKISEFKGTIVKSWG